MAGRGVFVSAPGRYYELRTYTHVVTLQSINLQITDDNMSIFVAFIKYLKQNNHRMLNADDEEQIAHRMAIGSHPDRKYAVDLVKTYGIIKSPMDEYAFAGLIWGLDHRVGVDEGFDYRQAIEDILRIKG
jgi:hypothetical protein